MKKCVELKIYGDVQGVSFRAQVYEIAKSLGLTGYVENKPDGTVKIIAEGDETALKKLIKECYTIPSARIEKIDIEWKEENNGFSGFGIRY